MLYVKFQFVYTFSESLKAREFSDKKKVFNILSHKWGHVSKYSKPSTVLYKTTSAPQITIWFDNSLF